VADRKTIAKIMREQQLRSRVARRRRIRTADSDHAHPPAPNGVGRAVAAAGLDAVWLCDKTYKPTPEGFV
jgi:hypothetical protein